MNVTLTNPTNISNSSLPSQTQSVLLSPTSNSTNPVLDASSSTKTLPVGTIVGIVIGALAFVVILAIIALYFYYRRPHTPKQMIESFPHSTPLPISTFDVSWPSFLSPLAIRKGRKRLPIINENTAEPPPPRYSPA